MARDEQIDARLWRWAEWLKSGDGAGYPVKSTLHEDWCPPSPGMRPGMKVASACDGPQTHRLVMAMTERMRATVTAHYLLRMAVDDAAQALDCQPGTVHMRIESAHRWMAGRLDPGWRMSVEVLQHRRTGVDSGTLA